MTVRVRRTDPFERHGDVAHPEPPEPRANRRGSWSAVDAVVRHALAFGLSAFLGLPMVVYGILVSMSNATACDEAGRADCDRIANQQAAALLIALGLVGLVAMLALIGAIRGLAVGWPGDRSSHRIRFAIAIVAALPMNAITLTILGAWFVHWYRT